MITEHKHWQNHSGCSESLAIIEYAQKLNKPIIVITTSAEAADKIFTELNFFKTDKQLEILNFPDWETLPYDRFSPHQDIISQRLHTFYQLLQNRQTILVITINAAMFRLAPHEYIQGQTLIFEKNQTLDTITLRTQLIASGYHLVTQVMEHGEFAVRGSIVDIFPMGSKIPYRLDFFGDELDSIREFDPENQRSAHEIPAIKFLPAHEFPLTANAITQFAENWQQEFGPDYEDCAIYENAIEGICIPGIEYYLPLFFKKTACIFDYLSSNTEIISSGNTHQSSEKFWQEINTRYEQLRFDRSHPLISPTKMFFPTSELFGIIKHFQQITIEPNLNPTLPDLTLNYKLPEPLTNLTNFINSTTSQKILFCAESKGRQEALVTMLARFSPTLFNSWQEFQSSEKKFGITITQASRGMVNSALAIIPENLLYGEQVMQRRLREQQAVDSGALIRDLTELKIGDPVVHIDYGVGKYLGLQSLTISELENEYLVLEYANEAKLYVPITSLGLISRYLGTNPEQLQYSHLGTKQWEHAKRKAIEKIHDVAASLLEIYAKRAAKNGYNFSVPAQNYQAFCDNFPFELTMDQATAIDAIIKDMTSDKPMDRLICGDVGFGKTEVAMRAAFLAVNDNKQVVVLVPTTILAQQHYNTFKDRFAGLPVNIELLSRFTSPKANIAAIAKLAEGGVDIVIGTHKLLQSNIKYKDLGLLIIDEEHRFGVKQKEKIKALRTNIDILTLTATPIPRTLNMSLAKIRDLSIIATPPAKRLAIKTFVYESNQNLIREAVLREVFRGGQTYFLHNEVATIQKTAATLRNLLPEARITIAHGQMREHELEQVMREFYHQRFNVLVCSTIIESGIDVPSANTIIINKADHFGLAQLHQLRGRVGRSHHQAYAYLLISSFKTITKDAQKRLDAIASMEELGSGFMLAVHDLEIRGAGEILGEEQSGQIQNIGFNLYLDFLDETVNAMQSGRIPNFDEPYQACEIELPIPSIIPEKYINDVQVRLSFYKKIANTATSQELRELQVELIDRFGLLPTQTKNLFAVSELKIFAKQLGVKKIKASQSYCHLEFIEQPKIDPQKIIMLIQKYPAKYKLAGKNQLKCALLETKEHERYLANIEQVLHSLVH